MGGSIGGIAAAPLLLMGNIDGSLEFRVQTQIQALCDVGWNLGTDHGSHRLSWSRTRILVVFLFVALVVEHISSTGCYWLDAPRKNLIQVFILLYV